MIKTNRILISIQFFSFLIKFTFLIDGEIENENLQELMTFYNSFRNSKIHRKKIN